MFHIPINLRRIKYCETKEHQETSKSLAFFCQIKPAVTRYDYNYSLIPEIAQCTKLSSLTRS